MQGRQLSRTLSLGFGADGQFGTTDDPANVASGSQLAFPTTESERAPLTEYMKYNELGQQVAHLSFEGKVTQLVYENDIPGGSGRLKEQRYFNNLSDYSGGSGTATENIEFLYDAFGRTVEKRWIRSAMATDVWTAQFDAFGRVTKETSPQGTVNYSYDHLGRKTRTYTTVPDGQGGMNITNDTEFEYDALGRLAKVSVVERNDAAVSPAERTTYRYDLAGNMDYQTTPDGVVADQVFDALLRLDKLTNYRPDPNTPGIFTDNPKLAEFDYSVRSDGKRTNATETFWLDADNDPQTAPMPHMNTIAWSYDGAGRLTDEVFDHYDNSLDFAEHYDFDLTGNRLRKTLDTGGFVGGAPASPAVIDEAIHYLYDANDRLLEEQLDADNDGTADQTTTYEWNATQQVSKSVTSTGSTTPTSTQTFAYNLQGRMSGIELSDFDATGQLTRKQTLGYSYGPDGIRVSTTDAIDTNGDGDIDPPRTKTEYLIDGHDATGYQQIIQEVTTNADTGAELKRVIYNIGLDQISLTTVASGGPSAGETLFFHIDGHGSTRMLTNAAGAVTTAAGALQLFHFDAYGNPLGFNPSQGSTSFLYNNEQRDIATGLYNFRIRPYDSLTARLLGLDPFTGNSQDPQSFHKYAFVHGDPIQGADPTGEFNSLTGFFVSVGIGAVVLVATNPNPVNAPAPRDALIGGDALVAAVPMEFGGGLAGRVVVRFVGGIARQAFEVLPAFLNWRFAKSGVGTVIYEGIDEYGRHGGIKAWLTRDMLDKGTEAASRIKPPGWTPGGTNQARGHLLARMLGGDGEIPQNLVTLIQNPVNSPFMRDIEQEIYNAVDAGEIVEFVVKPIYRIGSRDTAPTALRIVAIGDRGLHIDTELYNF